MISLFTRVSGEPGPGQWRAAGAALLPCSLRGHFGFHPPRGCCSARQRTRQVVASNSDLPPAKHDLTVGRTLLALSDRILSYPALDSTSSPMSFVRRHYACAWVPPGARPSTSERRSRAISIAPRVNMWRGSRGLL
jgi:hypothetical protein